VGNCRKAVITNMVITDGPLKGDQSATVVPAGSRTSSLAAATMCWKLGRQRGAVRRGITDSGVAE
jgi:hypothetical protein